MAEAVGLALGTVALASLFTTCIEAMEYFELCKSYKYDYELACLKLSLLKARLGTCGQTLGVNKHGQEDTELQRHWRNERNVIQQSLQGIAGIFGDAEQLKSKYSVLPRKRRWRFKATLQRSGPARSLKDKPDYRLIGHCYRISLVRRSTSWAIRDKRKFDGLIDDLEFFISNLEAVSSRLRSAFTSSLEMNNKGSVPQSASGANRSARRSSSQASPPTTMERKDSQQSISRIPSDNSDAQSRSSSHSEQGYSWSVEKMEDRSGAFFGNSGGAVLEPAPEGQIVTFKVGVTKDDARVMGGAMSSTDLDVFFNGTARRT
ncbi:MAG: hypothetical protein M1820_003067 [Bogoriella megaspora]|nr:MAG: hypothetical protein M1820_003067 [Bogoriella megaspora]